MELNIFDREFQLLEERHRLQREIKVNLTDGLNKLNGLKRETSSLNLDLAKLQQEVNSLRNQNQKCRESLTMCMIERDQLATRKLALESEIKDLQEQLEILDKESNSMLNDESIEQACQAFSTKDQLAIIYKLHEAKNKLIKYRE